MFAVALTVVACLLALSLGIELASGGAITSLFDRAPRPPGAQGPVQLGVAGLEPGACVAYPPTAGAMGKTVFIDPGHGGVDSGVVGTAGGGPVAEKDATLATALKLRDLLRAGGYRVVMARTADSSVMKLTPSDTSNGLMTADAVRRDLEKRIECANTSGAAVLVSIHFDGFSDPSVGGTETFYDAARPFAASNKRLAADLQSALVARLGSTDRGVWTDDQVGTALSAAGQNYGHLILLGPQQSGYVDQPSQMPGALVEPLFVTDPNDAAVLSDPSGQQKIAKALETGLQKYLSGS